MKSGFSLQKYMSIMNRFTSFMGRSTYILNLSKTSVGIDLDRFKTEMFVEPVHSVGVPSLNLGFVNRSNSIPTSVLNWFRRGVNRFILRFGQVHAFEV